MSKEVMLECLCKYWRYSICFLHYTCRYFCSIASDQGNHDKLLHNTFTLSQLLVFLSICISYNSNFMLIIHMAVYGVPMKSHIHYCTNMGIGHTPTTTHCLQTNADAFHIVYVFALTKKVTSIIYQILYCICSDTAVAVLHIICICHSGHLSSTISDMHIQLWQQL